MKVIKTVQKQIEVDEIEDVICNKCGGSCYSEYNYEGLIETEIYCGYGSKIGDGDQFCFSLCEDCLKVLMKSFKHSAFVRNDLFSEDEVGPI